MHNTAVYLPAPEKMPESGPPLDLDADADASSFLAEQRLPNF